MDGHARSAFPPVRGNRSASAPVLRTPPPAGHETPPQSLRAQLLPPSRLRAPPCGCIGGWRSPCGRKARSEEHTSELQSLMRISYAVFCLKKKNKTTTHI